MNATTCSGIRPMLVACMMTVACTASESGNAEQRVPRRVPAWTLSAEPALQLGVVEGDTNYELYQARSSVRFIDGRIVVANAGTRELLFYDSAGRFMGRSGGRGGGPGEFQFIRRIHRLAGDSILALDWSRASVFDPEGRFVRTESFAQASPRSSPREAWIYRRFLVMPTVEAHSRAAIARTLDRLPAPRGADFYRIARPGPDDRVWLMEARETRTDGAHWTIVSASGVPVASLVTPPRFELHHAGPDFVLGRWLDENDVNFIRLYPLEHGTGTVSVPDWLLAERTAVINAPPTQAARDAMTIGVRTVVTRQEGYYADHGRYADDARVLAMTLPDAVRLAVIQGHSTGWLAVMVSGDEPALCGTAVGSATPLAWTEAELYCGGS